MSEKFDRAEKECIGVIMNQYWKAREKYERMVKSSAARELSVCLVPPFEYRTYNDEVPVPLKLSGCPNGKSMARLRVIQDNQTIQKAPIIKLQRLIAMPKMQYWTLTETNIEVPDQLMLSHIPFFGDDKNDEKFIVELKRLFPDGIHGTNMGCGEYMNDFILFHLIKDTRAALPNHEAGLIYRAIVKQFPNKASPTELSELMSNRPAYFSFLDLQMRFEPSAYEELTKQLRSASSVATLSTYETLICYKCFAYDCQLHNATVSEKYRAKRRFASGAANSAKRPILSCCSDDCYLALIEPADPNQPISFKRLSVEIIESFSEEEEQFLSILKSSDASINYCHIAKTFNACAERPRTCRQIYEAASRSIGLSPPQFANSAPLRTKKKIAEWNRTFRSMKWASADGKVENNSRFKPCAHAGDCTEASGCRCAKAGNLCTKFCACGEGCRNGFPGCQCTPGNCRTRQCQCFRASWECDPDVCKLCHCGKFKEDGKPICRNISIQRGYQKRLLVAPSQVAGWGCFAQEDIARGEFISEYCGEVISQTEAERRGKIYDRIKCSYLFALNDEEIIDATRVGNLIRFANHSNNPNCFAKVMVVNAEHKIGIFANQNIRCGEELFFNYAYNHHQQIAFVPKELPKKS